MKAAKSSIFAVGRVLRKGASWIFQALVVIVALFVLFIAVTPQGKTGFNTVLFVHPDGKIEDLDSTNRCDMRCITRLPMAPL